jgi:2-polyprenyl-3-methyl-5-hydroxy-6-metoxy-1,4-benzoquinol methylase
MPTQAESSRQDRASKNERRKQAKRNVLNRLLENPMIRKVDYRKYRDKVRDVYGGPQGAILAACSLLSLHTPFGDRLLRARKFDLRGARQILDVGSGAGQIARHVLKYADPEAKVTCVDLSHEMLRRARNRLKSDRPFYTVADLSNLPFADGTFDCITCGYVLEHLPDARSGLAELSRIMRPGGRMLLFTTEENFSGACTSMLWCCRTYNREELAEACNDVSLQWNKDLWFSPLHRVLRAGGICAELVKQ